MLIDNWHKCYKLWSVRFSAFGLALSLAWKDFPEDLKDYIPTNVQPYLAALFFFIIFSRVVKQKK